MTEKLTLANAVREKIRAGRHTFQELADIARVSASTVRTWVERDKFPPQSWKLIAPLLGLPSEEAELRSTFQFTGWARPRSEGPLHRHLHDIMPNARQGLDDFLRRTSGHRSEGVETVRDLFAEMGRNDLFVFTSFDVHPLEFHVSPSCFNAAVGAVAAGATLLYIRPSAKALELYKTGWGIDHIGMDQLRSEYKRFADRLWEKNQQISADLEGEQSVGGAQIYDDGQTAGGVAQIYYDNWTPFWVPQCSFGWYRSASGNEQRIRVRLPSTSGAAETVQLLPVDLHLTDIFRDFVLRVSNEFNDSQEAEGKRVTESVFRLLGRSSTSKKSAASLTHSELDSSDGTEKIGRKSSRKEPKT